MVSCGCAQRTLLKHCLVPPCSPLCSDLLTSENVTHRGKATRLASCSARCVVALRSGNHSVKAFSLVLGQQAASFPNCPKKNPKGWECDINTTLHLVQSN